MNDKKLEEFEGIVDEIIYTNEENGYTVASFLTIDETVTIVGIMPYIYEGESLKIYGYFTNHTDYGEQLKVEYYERIGEDVHPGTIIANDGSAVEGEYKNTPLQPSALNFKGGDGAVIITW